MAAPARAEDLLDLARSRDSGDRQRLLSGLADLLGAGRDAARDAAVRPLLDDVFTTVALESEPGVRRILAAELARAGWAPRALVETLAQDSIEVARPLLAYSPLLGDDALARLVPVMPAAHQIEVARRPGIGAATADALLAAGDPAVLAALAGNPAAAIDEPRMERLVEAARGAAALRAPLVRHPALSRRLAVKLYPHLGDTLRAALQARFPGEAAGLTRAADEAARDAFFRGDRPSPNARPARDAAREEMERRLAAKLLAAGRLRPGYLLRSLRDGEPGVFEAALCALGGFESEAVRRAVRERPDRLALACAAVGVDRLAFPEILSRARRLNGLPPDPAPAQAAGIAEAFRLQPQAAAEVFRTAALG